MATTPIPVAEGRTEALKELAKQQPALFRQLIRSYQVAYGALLHRAGQPYPFEALLNDIIRVEVRQGLLFSKKATCLKCGREFGTNLDSKWCSKCEEKERYRDMVHLGTRYGSSGKSSRACIHFKLPMEGKKTDVLEEVTCMHCHGVVESEKSRNSILSDQRRKRAAKERLKLVQAGVLEKAPKDIRRRDLKEMSEAQVIAAGKKAVELMGYEVSSTWRPESIEYVVACEAKLKLIHDYDFDCYGCGAPTDHGKTKPGKLPLCHRCLPLFFEADCTREFWLIMLDLCMEKGVFESIRLARVAKLKEEQKQEQQNAST